MELKARPLEVLRRQPRLRIDELLRDREAKQRDGFAVGDARVTELQPMLLPVGPEPVTEVMSCLAEVLAALIRVLRRRLEGLGPEQPTPLRLGRSK